MEELALEVCPVGFTHFTAPLTAVSRGRGLRHARVPMLEARLARGDTVIFDKK